MKPLARCFEPAVAFVHSYRWPPFSLAAGGALVAGLAMLGLSPDGEVREIAVRKIGPLPEVRTFVDDPDLYVVLRLKNGLDVRTAARANTPIGNGISWPVGKGVSFASIKEILLYDEDFFKDDILDRVQVSQRQTKGQNYEFELKCASGIGWLLGLLTMAVSAPYLAFALFKFARDQAI